METRLVQTLYAVSGLAGLRLGEVCRLRAADTGHGARHEVARPLVREIRADSVAEGLEHSSGPAHAFHEDV